MLDEKTDVARPPPPLLTKAGFRIVGLYLFTLILREEHVGGQTALGSISATLLSVDRSRLSGRFFGHTMERKELDTRTRLKSRQQGGPAYARQYSLCGLN